jgi:hypothetical protein
MRRRVDVDLKKVEKPLQMTNEQSGCGNRNTNGEKRLLVEDGSRGI